MDLIFGPLDCLAAEFQSRMYASGGRQVDCVTVLCGVVISIPPQYPFATLPTALAGSLTSLQSIR